MRTRERALLLLLIGRRDDLRDAPPVQPQWKHRHPAPFIQMVVPARHRSFRFLRVCEQRGQVV
jgi:hypothetical protein